MPKNKKGGSGHKKQANKYNGSYTKSKVRLVKDKDEIYAKVTSLHGNGMAEVLCNDEKKRLLIIRRRFKGRNKRDNFVSVDKIVLVGLRSYEVVSEKKKQKVDLLYVYNNEDISDLKNDTTFNLNILPDSLKISMENNPFDITNKKDWSKVYEEEQEEKTQKAEQKIKKEEKLKERKQIQKNKKVEEEINWDDI
tara:strand:+ start:169 stop:750 length:582 start_codon:yes stop_codon:yes gene_type:complete